MEEGRHRGNKSQGNEIKLNKCEVKDIKLNKGEVKKIIDKEIK